MLLSDNLDPRSSAFIRVLFGSGLSGLGIRVKEYPLKNPSICFSWESGHPARVLSDFILT